MQLYMHCQSAGYVQQLLQSGLCSCEPDAELRASRSASVVCMPRSQHCSARRLRTIRLAITDEQQPSARVIGMRV